MGVEIHFLTKEAYRFIVAHNPHVDKVYTIHKRVGEVSQQLKRERYDYIVDLHKNLRSFLVKLRLPFVRSYTFQKLNLEKWLLVNFKINLLPKKHIVDRYMEGIAPLGVQNDGAGLDFFINENQVAIKKIIPRCDYIALVIGAGKNTKALIVEQIVSFINKTKEVFVLLGGGRELDKEKQILRQVNRPIISLVGQISLEESAYCIKQSKLVITGDTGMMHIAAAFQKPIFSIWGNTIPEFGMYPYYGSQKDKNKTIEVKDLSCRPCSKIGYDTCPKRHFKCIRQIDLIKDILQKV